MRAVLAAALTARKKSLDPPLFFSVPEESIFFIKNGFIRSLELGMGRLWSTLTLNQNGLNASNWDLAGNSAIAREAQELVWLRSKTNGTPQKEEGILPKTATSHS